jgi:hypothetical protein
MGPKYGYSSSLPVMCVLGHVSENNKALYTSICIIRNMRNVLLSTLYELIKQYLYSAAVETEVTNVHQGEDYSSECSPYAGG